MTKMADDLARSVEAALQQVAHAEGVLASMILADETEDRFARHLYIARTALSRLQNEIEMKRKPV